MEADWGVRDILWRARLRNWQTTWDRPVLELAPFPYISFDLLLEVEGEIPPLLEHEADEGAKETYCRRISWFGLSGPGRTSDQLPFQFKTATSPAPTPNGQPCRYEQKRLPSSEDPSQHAQCTSHVVSVAIV